MNPLSMEKAMIKNMVEKTGRPIDEWIEIQKTLSEMGFVIYELVPGFNIYEGSEIIGNTTFLARLIGKNLN